MNPNTGKGNLPKPGQQYAYFYRIPNQVFRDNKLESGWNHFCFRPDTTVITEDMTENLVLLPGEAGSEPDVVAYGVKAPYDAVVTVFATCLVDFPLYPGKAGDTPDTYSTRTTCTNYLLVGKNYDLVTAVGPYETTIGYQKEISQNRGLPFFLPVTQRGVDVSPDCLAATSVFWRNDTPAQVMTVYTTALVKKDDVINISLFVASPNYEDGYNVRQSVTNFQTQIGFTKAVESETGPVLLQALNPVKPTPMSGFVYSA